MRYIKLFDSYNIDTLEDCLQEIFDKYNIKKVIDESKIDRIKSDTAFLSTWTINNLTGMERIDPVLDCNDIYYCLTKENIIILGGSKDNTDIYQIFKEIFKEKNTIIKRLNNDISSSYESSRYQEKITISFL